MPVKLTPESFLSVLKRSGLIKPDLLKRLLDQLREQGISLENPQAVADALVAEERLTRWQADKLLQGMYKGFFLGKYRLLSLLGKGGMSSVYLAEHVLMRRRCAIKVLPFNLVDDSSYLARFHREAQAVAALDHPNIVRAYDVDVDKGVEKNREVHFLVMEYVSGRSLQETVPHDGPIGFVQAADTIRQAADGLQHAHQAGMVHRDIKPGNLLVDLNGLVKILDLGLARFFDDQDEEPLTVEHDQKILGTADYLAPEQALDSHSADARADIYSLGCTFYFLLAGRPPFTDGTLAQRLMSHQAKEPPSLKGFRDDVPAGLVEIIEKMMAKNPADRYQTAEDVSQVVSNWLKRNAGDDWKPHPPASTTKMFEVVVQEPEPSSLESDEQVVVGWVDEEDPRWNLSNSGSRASTHHTDLPAIPVDSSSPSSLPVAKPVPVAEPVSAKESTLEETEFETQEFPVLGSTELVHDVFTQPPESGRVGSSRRKQTPKQPGQKSAIKYPLIVVGTLLVIVGIGFALSSFWGDDPKPDKKTAAGQQQPKQKQPKRKPKQVPSLPREISVGPQGDFETIGEALARVKESFRPRNRGDKQIIKVQGGQTYPERIVIDNSDKSFEDIRIHLISDGDSPAILAPPSGDKPVVLLKDVKRFTLEGFELNAGGGKTVVVLSGFLPGTKLRNLKIAGFSEAGLSGIGPTGYGAKNERIVLEKIDFRSSSPNAVGIRFSSLKKEDDEEPQIPAQIVALSVHGSDVSRDSLQQWRCFSDGAKHDFFRPGNRNQV